MISVPVHHLHTTRAIVLRTFRHGDRSTVLKVLTEQFGPRSYMVRIGGKGGVAPGLLEPLARLELVVTDIAEKEMQQMREIRAERPYVRMAGDPVRGALALFTQEVLYQCLKQQGPDAHLFRSIHATLDVLDGEEELTFFPQYLLLQLAEHMGFFPSPGEGHEPYFDPVEGVFLPIPAPHVHGFDLRLSASLQRMIVLWPRWPSRNDLSPVDRRHLLDGLLQFFNLHVPGFGVLRSPEILHATLH